MCGRSMQALKRQLTEGRAAKQAAESTAEPLEWGRIMTEADFDRIKCALHCNPSRRTPTSLGHPSASLLS